MKKKILYSLLAVIIVISLFAVYTVTNPVSPLETVSLKNTNISITYSLSAGTYSIYTIPNSKSWDIFLNSEIYYFGINQPPSDSDIARFKVLTSQLFNPVEQFTIDFSGDSISNYIDFSWDKTKVSLPFKVK